MGHPKVKLTPIIIRAQVARHDAHWAKQRGRLRLYRHAYETKYWDQQALADNTLTIETSRAYEYIEGYVASLFSRNPSVVLQDDLRGRGDAAKAAALANGFLSDTRRCLEDASRCALIYPSAAVKLSPVPHTDPFKRVDCSVIVPWDLILDLDAHDWNRQRFVCHRYWVPLDVAKKRWGSKEYSPVSRKEWLDADNKDQPRSGDTDYDQFLQVCEVYDMVGDRLLVWSEQYGDGEKWLYDGIEIEDGNGQKVKITRIPFRDVSDHPVIPIAPLYYNRLPYAPLQGYAAMSRVYDQIREYNILRTFQANAVRKAARQWFVREGVLGPEGMARIAAGVDGEFISVDLPPGQSLSDVAQPVAHTPTPPETYQYLQAVQSDFERGSVLAPFTRGDATKATATEITALAAYSSSEVGRLARERDAMVEELARIYLSMVRLYLSEGDPDLLLLNGKAEVLSPEDLDGDFRIYAQDGGATPVSEAAKKAELVQIAPLLLQLGVPQADVLAELVRQYDLPKTFQAPPAPPAQPGPPVGAGPPPEDPGTLGIGPGEQPSPEQIKAVLPAGGVV